MYSGTSSGDEVMIEEQPVVSQTIVRAEQGSSSSATVKPTRRVRIVYQQQQQVLRQGQCVCKRVQGY